MNNRISNKIYDLLWCTTELHLRTSMECWPTHTHAFTHTHTHVCLSKTNFLEVENIIAVNEEGVLYIMRNLSTISQACQNGDT